MVSDRVGPPLLRRLLGSRRAAVRVGTRNGQVVGYYVLRRPVLSRCAWLYSLAVAAHMRGRGIGQRLLQDAEAVARAGGRRGVRLEVRQDNATALALYEAAGYRRSRHLPRHYQDGADGWRYVRTWDQP